MVVTLPRLRGCRDLGHSEPSPVGLGHWFWAAEHYESFWLSKRFPTKRECKPGLQKRGLES